MSARRHHLQEEALRARAQRSGDLRHDLTLFVALLREVGADVSPAATLHALRALTVVSLDRREDVCTALAACLTSSVRERALFDAVFETFWASDVGALMTSAAPDEASGEGGSVPGAGDVTTDTLQQAAPARPDARGPAGLATYSRLPGRPGAVRVRRRKDVEELAHRLARAIGTARGRREEPARHGERVDLRSGLRASLHLGGEMLDLRYTRRRRNRPHLVVFCDVSSSMHSSTPLFLAFAHALTSRVRRVDTAVFNVETVFVTEVFRRMDLRTSLRWLAHQQIALSGGTRIGHCLHTFLDDLETRGGPAPDTVALILSDGWDVGEPELLVDGMRRLRRQVRRVVWCDPHAADTDFRPQVQGLKVALPFVDDYVDFSSVTSLARLVERLASPVPTKGRQPLPSPP